MTSPARSTGSASTNRRPTPAPTSAASGARPAPSSPRPTSAASPRPAGSRSNSRSAGRDPAEHDLRRRLPGAERPLLGERPDPRLRRRQRAPARDRQRHQRQRRLHTTEPPPNSRPTPSRPPTTGSTSSSLPATRRPGARAHRPGSARPPARNRRPSTGPRPPATAAARSPATGSPPTSGRRRRRRSRSPAPATSKTITGLTGGTPYTFKVAAVNAIGTGPDSAASNSVTPTAPTVPDAPTGVSATAGQEQATVNWTAPANNGGSAITSYRVTPYIGATAQAAVDRPRPGRHEDDHRPHRRHRLHLQGRRRQRGRDRGRLGRLERGDADGPAAGPRPGDRGERDRRPGTGDRQLDRARQRRRQPDHQLPGHALHRVDGADAGHGRGARDLEDDHRPHRRHRLHLQGRGDQRGRDRAGLGGLELGDADRADGARRPDRRQRDRRPGTGDRELDRPGEQRRQRDHELPGDALHRVDRADAGHRRGAGDIEDDHRPHRRHRLHLQGRRRQRDRDRAGLGGIELGDADRAHGAGSADGRERNRRPRTGDRELDRPGQQRRQRDHQLPGHPIHRDHRPDTGLGPAPATSKTITGLTGGTAYTFKVAAINAVGTGPDSAASNSVTPTAPTAPGRPDRRSRATGRPATGDRQLDRPGEQRRQPDHQLPGHAVHRVDGADAGRRCRRPATSKTITGLTGGTAYTFKVAAINAIGTGPDSEASNSVTPTALTAPDAPTGVSATGGQEQATVNWTAPANNGGSAITSYRVTPYIGSTAQSPVTVAGAGHLEDDHRPHRRHRLHLQGRRRSTRSAPGRTPRPRTR